MPDRISIIVPVYNRAREVADFLESFSKQTQKENWEIIIVDDGSTDDLKDVIKIYNNEMSLKYFYQNNQGPGLARNLGMQNAKGDILVFIDSDCTVPENYIEILNDHLKKQQFDFFGGPDTQKEDFSPFLKAVNYSMTSFLGTGGTRGRSGKSVARYYPRSFNMGIKKYVYQKVGGMNDLRHGQDMEFSNRIFRAGFKAVFLSDLIVFHRRRTNLRRFFKQIFNWGVTRINLGSIDRQMLKPVHALPAILITIVFVAIFLSFFCPLFHYLLTILFLAAIASAFFTFLHSSFRNHSTLVGLLSVITLFTQVFAYGSGFLIGSVKKIFTPKGKWVNGFTRKYYK